MQDVTDRIVKIIQENGLGNKDIVPEADLCDDLGMDSMDILELTMAVETEFNIEIEDAVFDEWQTLQDVIDTVVGLMKPPTA